MPITLNTSAVTNRDWKTQFQFNDGETGALLDLTGAYIVITLEDANGCPMTYTSDSEITIISPGVIELTVDDSAMNMCPGTYRIGAFYQLAGETIDLFEGEVTIRRGIGKP